MQDAESIAPPSLPPINDEQQLANEELWLANTIQARFASR
jgi:hypothetical protein